MESEHPVTAVEFRSKFGKHRKTAQTTGEVVVTHNGKRDGAYVAYWQLEEYHIARDTIEQLLIKNPNLHRQMAHMPSSRAAKVIMKLLHSKIRQPGYRGSRRRAG